MDSKNKILNQIFKILVPLRASYKDEIDKVTNDLLIGYDKSLEDFINKYYGNTNYSNEMVSLVVSLVNANLIPSTYLEEVSKKVQTNISLSPIYKQTSVRPINVKIINFNKIKNNILNKKPLDPTRFPISIITDKKEVSEPHMEITQTNPNLAPVEITPDENTKPDIILPQEDMNMELPDFNKMAIETPNVPAVDTIVPKIEPDFEIPPIMINQEPQVTPIALESQNVMSKDDIINSLKEPEETHQEEVVNPDLKHTTQLGQLLQFPINSQTNAVEPQVTLPEVTPSPAPITPEPVTPPVNVPTPDFSNVVSQVPTYQEEVHEPEPTTYQEPVTNVSTPDFSNVVSQVPTYQEEITKPEPTTYQEPVTNVPTPDFSNVINQVPTYQEEITKPEPVTYQEPVTNVSTPDFSNVINQVPTYQEETHEPEPITYQEPITLDLPAPDTTYKVAETPKEEPENNYSKEELTEEIAAKVREEVKKQVTEQITKELAEQIRLEEKNNIVRIQNNYMNNASAFIQNLNSQSEEEIYMSLRYLNDLKYMSHCITHLNLDTLERFYRFIEDKLNSPQSEFMDGFIEKRIREKLPPNLIEQIDEGMKKVA